MGPIPTAPKPPSKFRAELKLPVVFALRPDFRRRVQQSFKAREPRTLFGYVLKTLLKEPHVGGSPLKLLSTRHSCRAGTRRNDRPTAGSGRARQTTAEGMLPVCAWCKKVRSDEGSWMTVDQYLRTRSESWKFSARVCLPHLRGPRWATRNPGKKPGAGKLEASQSNHRRDFGCIQRGWFLYQTLGETKLWTGRLI